MDFDVNNWLHEQINEKVIFSYSGIVSPEIITSSLAFIESKMEERGENSKKIKKIYNVVVECLQNLFHHSEFFTEGNFPEKYSAFILIDEGNYLKVITGNYINEERSKFLKDRINQLNLMSHDEIKDLYKMVLNNDEYSDKGGGGLGMIDIVKRTESKIEYKIKNISEIFYFYIFEVKI